MKRVICTALLISLLASLTACGGSGAADETTASGGEVNTDTSSAETVNERYLIKEDLPEKDYNGKAVRILMRNSTSPDWIGDMFSDEATGEVIGDAIFARNQKVSEQFGVTFELFKSSSSNYETDGVKVILAGEDAYDIIVPHARASFKYAEQSLCLDWNDDLPYVDLDKPWWDQDARNSFEINGKLYTMVGDISYQSLAQTNCMMFNQSLFDEYQEEYPYQKVVDGKWTFDEFTRLVKLCSEDVNGDGKYTPDTDVYGYVTYQWVGSFQALTASGGRIASKGDSGNLELTINTERNVNAYEDFFSLLYTDNCFVELDRFQNKSLYDCRKLFSEGRSLFLDGALNDISALRDMKEDFGIIPWPKYDESCERYYTNVDAGTNLFIIPITVGDAEMVSIILEALSAEGYREVIPAYYDVALQHKYIRDELSIEMLETIKAGRVYDIGYYYCGGTFASAGSNLVEAADHSFTSYYAKNETAVKTSLQKIIDEYGKG